MDEESPTAYLLHANRLLAESAFLLDHYDGERRVSELLAEAERCCAEAARHVSRVDAETSTTIAILCAMTAGYALRHAVLFQVRCDFDDNDGTLLDGMNEYDKEGLTRPLADKAIRAAREAIDADPANALGHLYLGHALTWSGDRDGATTAYREALHRNPGDDCPRSALDYLDAAPQSPPSPHQDQSSGGYGFALLRVSSWINNNDSATASLLFRSVDAARSHADLLVDMDARGRLLAWDEDECGPLQLSIHRPGHGVIECDLAARTATKTGDAARIDWSDLHLAEVLDSPLPVGRPLRVDTATCYHE